MNTQKFIFFFLALATFFVVFWLASSVTKTIPTITTFEECIALGNSVMESYPRQCREGDQTFVENIGNELEKSDLIQIISPRPNQEITSPLVMEGKARGTWFFEGDFPIELQDQNGEIIVQHYATAGSDWMTEEFVPFKAIIEFDSVPQNGTLVLEKDNPSGLLENADELRVPVKISESKIPIMEKVGTLFGVVTVGPICPVEREGEACDIPPEVYTSRSIIIYSEDKKKEIARTNFNPDGTYKFSLKSATYIVDIAKLGIDSSSDLPTKIFIESGEGVELNFEIDTGIR